MIATEHKIEIRRLTRKEMYQLLNEASNEEIKYISKFSADQDLDPCEFFENFSHEYLGMVEDGRPAYVAALMRDDDGQYDFWTIANKDINNMISLCKNAKKILNKWLGKYHLINAYMPKGNLESIKWVEWLGFEKIDEDEDSIHFIIKGD